jgi:hypothetical protein
MRMAEPMGNAPCVGSKATLPTWCHWMVHERPQAELLQAVGAQRDPRVLLLDEERRQRDQADGEDEPRRLDGKLGRLVEAEEERGESDAAEEQKAEQAKAPAGLEVHQVASRWTLHAASAMRRGTLTTSRAHRQYEMRASTGAFNLERPFKKASSMTNT